MGSIRVGVVRGGISGERDVSLKTGENVMRALASPGLAEKYSFSDIVLAQNGEWYFDGKPALPQEIFNSVDVVFNALHGSFGEDGKAQRLFEAFSVPYTGSGISSSAFGMNKILSKEIFLRAGIKVPKWEVLTLADNLEEKVNSIFRVMGPSWVVKPASLGSSIGVSVAHKFGDLESAVRKAFDFCGNVIVEEYVSGREATCGVLENFRGEEHYALPVIEIIPAERAGFFDYNSKYSGKTREVCPADFDKNIKKYLEETAKAAHRELGCRHYSRSDFIVSPKGIYILEINTLPGLTKESLLPKAVEAVGSSYNELIDHLISLAINKKQDK